MANWLYIWELGGGMGHMHRMASISQELEKSGDRVTWCVPHHHAKSARNLWSRVIENPQRPRLKTRVIAPGNLAEILQNQGWHQADFLSESLAQWQQIIHTENAEKILLDFAPNALLAAVSSDREVAVAGTGFYIPPKANPLPAFRHDHGVYPDRLRWAEDTVVAVVSDILGKPLNGLSDLFHWKGVDNHLASLAEWDHYPARTKVDYRGVVSASSGSQIRWPKAAVQRIFAYLRPFPGLPALLGSMRALGAHVQVHGNAMVKETVERLDCKTITFCDQPVDERSVAESRAVMVNHAGHDGTVKAALAGIAMLHLPLTIEQSLTAKNAAKLGISEWIASHTSGEFTSTLKRLLNQQTERQKAARDWAVLQTPVTANLQRLVSSLLE